MGIPLVGVAKRQNGVHSIVRTQLAGDGGAVQLRRDVNRLVRARTSENACSACNGR